MSERVLVTGGAGFIGSNLCHALAAKGCEVVVLDDLSTGTLENLTGIDVRFVRGSIRDESVLHETAEGARTIVHLAARPSVPFSLAQPLVAHEVNVTGTLRVLEAARAIGAHVIVASSSSVYGSNPELPKRETATPMPVSPYAVSKLAAESYALAYARSFGVPAMVFRFFNVFGPHQAATHPYAAVIPKFIAAALAGLPLEVHGDGQQTRDFTYVGSVIDVLVATVEGALTHDGPVNLAFGTRVRLLDLIGELETVLGVRLTVHHAPPRVADVRDSQSDTRLLHTLFPFTTGLPLATALQHTVDWYKGVAH